MTLSTHYSLLTTYTMFMSMPWHHNDLAALAGIFLSLSLSSSHTKFSPLFVIMEPMIFTYSFTINGYDVTVTIEFFPHIVVLEDFFPKLTDDGSENVDVSLDL